MATEFQADPRIAEIANAYALDALEIAVNNFSVVLDWTDGSVRQVEQMLGRLHDELTAARPPEDAIWTFAKAFGSYVGEVLRKSVSGGERRAWVGGVIGTKPPGSRWRRKDFLGMAGAGRRAAAVVPTRGQE